jgi:hypothetical protein
LTSIVLLTASVSADAQSLPPQFRDREAIGLLFGQAQHDESLAGGGVHFGISAVLQQIEQLAGFPRAQRCG